MLKDLEQRSLDSLQSLYFDPNVLSSLRSKWTSAYCLVFWAVHSPSQPGVLWKLSRGGWYLSCVKPGIKEKFTAHLGVCNSTYFWVPSERKPWFSSEHYRSLLSSMSSPAFIYHRCLCNPHTLYIFWVNTAPSPWSCILYVCVVCTSAECVLVCWWGGFARMYSCSFFFGGFNQPSSNCGFSMWSRALADLPRNQCNMFPSFSSLTPGHKAAPSLFLFLSVFLFFPPPILLSCSEPLLKMEWVCAAYLNGHGWI